MNSIKSIFFGLTLSLCASVQAQVIDYFNQIKTDPNALYTFLKTMPKGGELHYHLAGGPYPETLLELVSQTDYCLNSNTLAVSKDTTSCDGVNTKELMGKPDLYSSVIKSWSMKDFIPGEESGHDHFFNGFIKYMPIVFDFRPQLLADVMRRAAAQNEQYLEIMDIPDNANSLKFGNLIQHIHSFDKKRQKLLADPEFQKNVSLTVSKSEQMIQESRTALGCDKNATAKACSVKINLLYYVLREQPPNTLFAQALNAFEAVSQSKNALVGVNLVQPEDGIISLRDYHKQMKVFQYLHKLYPQVKVSLHAGELTLNGATPKDLSNHIHDALFTAHALRIGHGVDIAYENEAEASLKYMAEQHIPVEINLVSNEKILNVTNKNHPLNYYLSHNVPVVLSTDDEGILRTDLTSQYVKAVIEHGLDYQTLKNINRNTLTYAFVPGKSIWTNAAKNQLRKECLDLNSKTCHQFIKENEKAQLQWNLEQKLKVFESKY